ncbi:hypothetical protein GCM10028774_07310 [Spirosoma jeollabukense]
MCVKNNSIADEMDFLINNFSRRQFSKMKPTTAEVVYGYSFILRRFSLAILLYIKGSDKQNNITVFKGETKVKFRSTRIQMQKKIDFYKK